MHVLAFRSVCIKLQNDVRNWTIYACTLSFSSNAVTQSTIAMGLCIYIYIYIYIMSQKRIIHCGYTLSAVSFLRDNVNEIQHLIRLRPSWLYSLRDVKTLLCIIMSFILTRTYRRRRWCSWSWGRRDIVLGRLSVRVI